MDTARETPITSTEASTSLETFAERIHTQPTPIFTFTIRWLHWWPLLWITESAWTAVPFGTALRSSKSTAWLPPSALTPSPTTPRGTKSPEEWLLPLLMWSGMTALGFWEGFACRVRACSQLCSMWIPPLPLLLPAPSPVCSRATRTTSWATSKTYLSPDLELPVAAGSNGGWPPHRLHLHVPAALSGRLHRLGLSLRHHLRPLGTGSHLPLQRRQTITGCFCGYLLGSAECEYSVQRTCGLGADRTEWTHVDYCALLLQQNQTGCGYLQVCRPVRGWSLLDCSGSHFPSLPDGLPLGKLPRSHGLPNLLNYLCPTPNWVLHLNPRLCWSCSCPLLHLPLLHSLGQRLPSRNGHLRDCISLLHVVLFSRSWQRTESAYLAFLQNDLQVRMTLCRYHLGSLAFGSLLVAIVQFLQIMV